MPIELMGTNLGTIALIVVAILAQVFLLFLSATFAYKDASFGNAFKQWLGLLIINAAIGLALVVFGVISMPVGM